MISVLIDAAFRSLFVGLIVVIGLRAFRIRNVFALKTTLGLVLVAAMAMPMLIPIANRLQILPASASLVLPEHPMTLLEELQAKIQAKSGSNELPKTVADPLSAANSPQIEESSGPASAPHAASRAKSGPVSLQPAQVQPERVNRKTRTVNTAGPLPQSSRVAFSPSSLALSVYLGVAALLLLRLVLGLGVTLRLWLTATPALAHGRFEIPAGLPLRVSSRVSSPLTIGSAILLPADYATWDREKFRIVLAHERSHVRQGDFYLQLLAGLYAALVWFSPLGWWLKKELADLAEAISDHAGIEEARSRASYAQVLLEFAVAPRATALGVAMARPGSLTRRIERLLNDHAFRQSFAGGRRALFAIVLVPLVLFAATAMVRVEAATHSATVRWSAPTSSSALETTAEAGDPTPQLTAENTQLEDLAVSESSDASANVEMSPDVEAPVITSPEVAATPLVPNLFPVPSFARAIAAQEEESGNSKSFDRTLTLTSRSWTVMFSMTEVEDKEGIFPVQEPPFQY